MQYRFSLPFIGGPQLILTEEEMKDKKQQFAKKFNDMKHLVLHDRKFQDEVFKALGITVAAAIAVYGLLCVWKWYFAYKVVVGAGGVVTTAAWVKGVGVAAVGATAAYETNDLVHKLRFTVRGPDGKPVFENGKVVTRAA